MSPTPAKQLEGFIAKFDPAIGKLARSARSALRKRFPSSGKRSDVVGTGRRGTSAASGSTSEVAAAGERSRSDDYQVDICEAATAPARGAKGRRSRAGGSVRAQRIT